MDKEKLLLAILAIQWTGDLNQLWEEDGLDVFFLIKHIHTGKDSSVLEGRQPLLVGGRGDICRGGRKGGGGSITEVRDVLRDNAIAHGAYRG